MTDIARAAGVSQSTVSRVINRHPGISETTRSAVIATMRELGYKPEMLRGSAFREPKRRRIRMAMCPLPEQKEPLSLEYFREILAGIRESFAGMEVDFDTEILPPDAGEFPGASECDGVILVSYPHPELRARLRREEVPYIIVSGDVYSSSEDLITVNRFEACVEAAASLLDSGVRRIGFLLSRYHAPQSDGFLSEMRHRGITVPEKDLRLVPDTELTSFVTAIHHWIAEGDLPEVLVVSYGIVANMVETMLLLNHVAMPEKVRLVAFDRHPGAKTAQLCIRSHPRTMGRHAVRRIMEKLEHPGIAPYHTIVPMTIDHADKESFSPGAVGSSFPEKTRFA